VGDGGWGKTENPDEMMRNEGRNEGRERDNIGFVVLLLSCCRLLSSRGKNRDDSPSISRFSKPGFYHEDRRYRPDCDWEVAGGAPPIPTTVTLRLARLQSRDMSLAKRWPNSMQKAGVSVERRSARPDWI
jgi:hypothetical protein